MAEETIAIAHENDPQLIQEVVSPNQNARTSIRSESVMHVSRKP
jgi:hypothetical protein